MLRKQTSLRPTIARAALLLAGSMPIAAQTPATVATASPTPSSSPVSTADFAWLAGSWEGKPAKLSDAVAEVTFQPPKAGLITGVMRLIQGDKVLVVELISMVDTPRGPEMRFRHFSRSLDAYESTFKQAMLLTSHDRSQDVFENTVDYDKALMSTQPRKSFFSRRGTDDMVAHSDIIGADGKPDVVEVTYHRRKQP